MKTKLAMAFVGLMALSNAYALPTIYPMSATNLGSIVNKTNSNLVADNEDPRVIFVMPPNSASSVVSGLHTINSNIGFCREMADQQSYSAQLSARLNSLETEEIKSKDQTDLMNEKLSKARAELSEHVVSVRMDEIVALDARLEAIELRLTELNDKLAVCSQYCQNLRLEIQELRAEKIEVSKSRRALAASRTKDVSIYEKKKAVVEALKEDLKDKEDAWLKLHERVTAIRNNFLSMYSSFAKMEGARAGIQFKSNWDENVDLLRQENPNFDFKKISTQNAVVTTNIANLENLPSGGAILGYEIGGAYSEGRLLMPAYPENMSANIRLSLTGACPMLHPDYFDINLPNGSQEMKYGMTVSYEYPTAFVISARARYNMYKMYQKIVSSGTKSGFFKSKSWSSVEEKTFFEDSFNVNWIEQDRSNSLTFEQKAELEREMRNNILGRLAAIGLPAISNASVLVTPPGEPKTGAVVLSESLKKTCPANVYCMGAAIAMDVLQAIFGSSSSTSSYTNIQKTDQYEDWSRTAVTYKPWISSYN
jgi:hypothetical protein